MRSPLPVDVGEMMREVADNVRALGIPATAHWIAEEEPKALTAALWEFLRSLRLSEPVGAPASPSGAD
jgi:hypothetical protein